MYVGNNIWTLAYLLTLIQMWVAGSTKLVRSIENEHRLFIVSVYNRKDIILKRFSHSKSLKKKTCPHRKDLTFIVVSHDFFIF